MRYLALLAIVCCNTGASAPDAEAAPHAAPRRLGASLDGGAAFVAGDAGPIPFNLTSPVTPPWGDPQVSQCLLTSICIDPAGGGVDAYVTCGLKSVHVQTSLTVPQLGAITSLVKTAAAAQLSTTFQ